MIRTSYSGLTTYENCPLSYKLSYMDGIRTPSGAAADRGTRLHLSCEKYLKGELPEERLPLEFETIKPALATYKGLGAKAEEVWLTSISWGYQEVEDETTLFKAIVDIHWTEDKTLHIRDLKSGRKYPEHDDQLQLYAAMGFSRYPDAVEVVVGALYLEGMGDSASFRRTIADPLQERWSDRALKLAEEREWKANPGPVACRWCSYAKMGYCDSPWGRK